MTGVRAPGHNLIAEGAAMKVSPDGLVARAVPIGVGGTGVAACSCGARSGLLYTGRARQRWHRDHKNDVWAQRAVAAAPAVVDAGPVRRAVRLTAAQWDWIDACAEAATLSRDDALGQLVDSMRTLDIGIG